MATVMNHWAKVGRCTEELQTKISPDHMSGADTAAWSPNTVVVSSVVYSLIAVARVSQHTLQLELYGDLGSTKVVYFMKSVTRYIGKAVKAWWCAQENRFRTVPV